MNEYPKYNLENYRPNDFMVPPTRKLGEEIGYVNKKLVESIEGVWVKHRRRLTIGTEFEVFFFSPDIDPWAARDLNYGENPNYQEGHLDKIRKLVGFSSRFNHRYQKDFLESDHNGQLMIEFRTAPQNYGDHIRTVTRFREFVAQKSAELNIRPVVHSQHIHFDLDGQTGLEIVSKKRITGDYIAQKGWEVIDSSFSRVLPLVLLPEEYRRAKRSSPYYVNHETIGKSDQDAHPEFRKLSSEYANDALLNLFICLRTMFAFVSDDDDFVSSMDHEEEFDEAVSRFRTDSEIQAILGETTVARLAEIVAQYPLVSSREINVGQIR